MGSDQRDKFKKFTEKNAFDKTRAEIEFLKARVELVRSDSRLSAAEKEKALTPLLEKLSQLTAEN